MNCSLSFIGLTPTRINTHNPVSSPCVFVNTCCFLIYCPTMFTYFAATWIKKNDSFRSSFINDLATSRYSICCWWYPCMCLFFPSPSPQISSFMPLSKYLHWLVLFCTKPRKMQLNVFVSKCFLLMSHFQRLFCSHFEEKVMVEISWHTLLI